MADDSTNSDKQLRGNGPIPFLRAYNDTDSECDTFMRVIERYKKNRKSTKKKKLKQTFIENGLLKSLSSIPLPEDPTYADVPQNHFFVLPAELRNRIYEDVLDSEMTKTVRQWERRYNKWVRNTLGWQGRDPETRLHFSQTREIKVLSNGQPYDSALLSVCRQMRNETTLMYYSKNEFQLNIRANELEGVRSWLSTITKKYGSEANDFAPLRKFSINIWRPEWADLGYFRALAYIVLENGASWGSVTWEVGGNLRQRLEMGEALDKVVRLGLLARKESWDEAKLFDELEEWLASKLKSKGVKRGRQEGFRVSALRSQFQDSQNRDITEIIKPVRFKQHGQIYATENRSDADDKSDHFRRTPKNLIPSTDRVTRLQNGARKVNYKEPSCETPVDKVLIYWAKAWSVMPPTRRSLHVHDNHDRDDENEDDILTPKKIAGKERSGLVYDSDDEDWLL